MALSAQRIYYNSADLALRIDDIYLEATSNVICTGTSARTYARTVKTTTTYGSGGYGTDRTVASIEVISNATSADNSPDILWIEWTSPSVHCGMSDLPGVGDTV